MQSESEKKILNVKNKLSMEKKNGKIYQINEKCLTFRLLH